MGVLPGVDNIDREARHLGQPGGREDLHFARRARQPSRADDEPPIHPVDHGLFQEAGEPEGRRLALRGNLQPYLEPQDLEGLHSRHGRRHHSEALDGAGAAYGVGVTGHWRFQFRNKLHFFY